MGFTFPNQVTEAEHGRVGTCGTGIRDLVIGVQLKIEAAFAGKRIAASNATKFAQLANAESSLVFGGTFFAGVWKVFAFAVIENHERNLDEAEEFGVITVSAR